MSRQALGGPRVALSAAQTAPSLKFEFVRVKTGQTPGEKTPRSPMSGEACRCSIWIMAGIAQGQGAGGLRTHVWVVLVVHHRRVRAPLQAAARAQPARLHMCPNPTHTHKHGYTVTHVHRWSFKLLLQTPWPCSTH